MGFRSSFTAACLLSVLVLKVSGQICLLNRIDVLPCQFRNPQSTETPDFDEYGIYSTRIRDGPVCSIRRRNHDVRTIDTVGGDPRLKLIFSPGIELQDTQEYGNQMIVFYNISCPVGHQAYFNINEIDMEEPNCLDPNTNTSKCVDYVQVSHGNGNFGITESCGTDPGVNTEVLTEGNLQVTLRTSDRGRYPGFKATVTCFNTTEVNSPPGQDSRRKRHAYSNNNFDAEIEKRVASLDKLKQYYLRHRGRLSYYYRRYYSYLWRFERVNVPYGVNVTFRNFVLSFRNVATQTITRRIRHIRFLHTFDSNGVIRVFRRSARDKLRQLIRFSGPGRLVIIGCHAYFTLFIVDPRGILPLTEEERSIINELSTAHFEQMLENPDERLCEEMVNPPPFDSNITLPEGEVPITVPLPPLQTDRDSDEPECPRPISTEPRTCFFRDETLRLALDNRNASNVLIRTLVDVLLTCTEREQPGRLEELGPLTALEVDCSISSTRDRNVLAVFCSSNREGNVTVDILSCDVDRELPLDEFCDFPSFTFPVFETGIRPGRHQLSLDFMDSLDSMTTELLTFSAPLIINCSQSFRSRSIPSTVANFSCVSNQQAPFVTVQECILDEETPLETCAFPRFQLGLIDLRTGGHTITVIFRDEPTGSTSRETISFIVPGFQ